MCRNCYDNCNGEIISDKCIRYTGDGVELLGICKGDQLSLVQSIILDKILTLIDGTGITPADVTLENAPDLKELLGYKDPILNNLLQVLIDSQQDLLTLVNELSGIAPFLFDPACLEGLDDNPSRDEILQASVTQLCSIKTIVDAIPTTYVKNSDLTTLVNQIIAGGTETTVATQQYLKMVPYVAMPYFGSQSNFDSQGKGLVGMGFDKVYLCNGLNGTPDIRGRVVAGAVQNVPGTTLDASVDPNSPSNPNTNYALGDKFGRSYHTLAVSEIPSHSHIVNDPGHTHNLATHENDGAGGSQQHNIYNGTDNDAVSLTLQTNTAFTNVSVQATGGGAAHNNVQPSIAALFIIHIP